MKLKEFNLMQRANETKFLGQHKLCEYICRINEIA